MILLAADTTTPVNTVAVCDDENVLGEVIVHAGRRHTERLLETIDWVLSEARLLPADVDAFAVSVGPGSFTGVRVGVAAFKGLALGLNRPLIPVPTLDAMSRLAPWRNGTVCVALDAKMAEVYGAVYRFTDGQREKLFGDHVLPISDLLKHVTGPAVFLGDGTRLYAAAIGSAMPEAIISAPMNSIPRGAAVAAEALFLLESGIATDAAQVRPVYLRRSQPEEARAKSKGCAGI